MPRQYKIKRSAEMMGRHRARKRPVVVIFWAVIVAGLVYLGILIYPPIHSAIMNWESGRGNAALPQLPGTGATEPGDEQQAVVAPPPVVRAGNLRAVYAPPALLADEAGFGAFISGLSGAGLNAVMVDIKSADGEVLFASQNQNANDWGAVVEDAFDLAALSEQLAGEGLFLVVRMSAFRDEIAARGQYSYSVLWQGADTGLRWLDNLPGVGRPWLSPHSEGARAYITELALEAAEAGAVMVVLDDVQFPPNSLTDDAYFGETGGLSRTQRLAAFAQDITETLAREGVRAAIYMPAIELVADQPNITFFGGPPAEILAEHTVLGALPYQFPPLGFESELLQLPDPLDDLSDTLTQVIGAVRGLTDSGLIVLIQGGSLPLGGMHYTDEQIMAQVETLAGLGIEEFIFFATYVGQYQLAIGD